MFPAKNGDSFLISFLGQSTRNILIDLAYPHTYRNYVKPKLQELHSNGESIDLVIFTHIDQDHIQGGITFFRENGDSKSPKIISVKEVWHNSYRHLSIGNENITLEENDVEKIKKRVVYVDDSEEKSSIKISGKQGTRLGALLEMNQYPWNTSFNSKAISFSNISKNIAEDVKIYVLSPTEVQLESLKRVWYKELRRMFPTLPLTVDTVFDDAVEFISQNRESTGVANKTEKVSSTTNIVKLVEKPFQEDQDEINASSITIIIEYYGKKILFLGDAPPTLVEEQLRKVYGENQFPIYFDLIKVSHHGSENNTNNSLMKLIDSNRYLISTNGKIHGHPNEATIARIVVRDSKDLKRELYMSYPTETSKLFDKKEWKEKYNYEIHTATMGEITVIEF
ncbi:MBL fold metallo-hydrolase [Bacillus sp. B1-b2]|uniref:MBL fold metallo-hydrolase n=1 Tax=Bacillus sp. B1-b2 TaxID=2653201 RepID=UPI001D02E5F3|nr:MBL fold metallo-hydrolase [Bacillus sp. B1-b2]